MSYKFPPIDLNGRAKSFTCDITVATRSVRTDRSTGFCLGLSGRAQVYDLDAIKDEWSNLRRPEVKGAKLCSADCCFNASDGTHYFIEFKNANREGLDRLTDEDGIPLPISLMRKAVDSLGLAAMTILQRETGKSIQDHSVFIVVYRPSAEDALGALEINTSLTNLSGGVDSLNRAHPIMWSLDELRNLGIYADVHTWPENFFVSWATTHLK